MHRQEFSPTPLGLCSSRHSPTHAPWLESSLPRRTQNPRVRNLTMPPRKPIAQPTSTFARHRPLLGTIGQRHSLLERLLSHLCTKPSDPIMKTKKLLITISENSMTRITWFGPESASPAVREIYDTTLRGKPGSVQEMLAHLPRVCLI